MPATAFDLINHAYLGYLDYLQEGGDRFRLPDHKHDPNRSVGKVHASSLLSCPLQSAFKRVGKEETLPFSDAERRDSLHLMQQGTRDAEPFQEALLWHYVNYSSCDLSEVSEMLKLHKNETGAMVEQRIEQPALTGRIDGIVFVEGEGHIFEFKRREPFPWAKSAHKELPDPKPSDAYQLMAYMMATGLKNGHIVAINRGDIKQSAPYNSVPCFNVWTLETSGAGYLLVNENGVYWDSEFNHPDFLNFDRVTEEIQYQVDYLDAVINKKPFQSSPIHPNDPVKGWLCGKHTKKPGVKVGGTYTRRCEWFCHGAGGPVFETVTGSDDKPLIILNNLL